MHDLHEFWRLGARELSSANVPVSPRALGSWHHCMSCLRARPPLRPKRRWSLKSVFCTDFWHVCDHFSGFLLRVYTV